MLPNLHAPRNYDNKIGGDQSAYVLDQVNDGLVGFTDDADYDTVEEQTTQPQHTSQYTQNNAFLEAFHINLSQKSSVYDLLKYIEKLAKDLTTKFD
jgi:hypothetical protein